MPQPKKHSGASARAQAAIERVTATGGARKSMLFPAETVAGMHEIRARTGDKSDTALISRLVADELKRLG